MSLLRPIEVHCDRCSKWMRVYSDGANDARKQVREKHGWRTQRSEAKLIDVCDDCMYKDTHRWIHR